MGSNRRFQVSTRRTGHYRIVKVRVYDTLDEMREALIRFAGHDESYWRTCGAATIARTSWTDRDPRPFQATVFFANDCIDLPTIVHECAHAAVQLYAVDGYRDNARAAAHLTVANEVLAYLVSDLFERIMSYFQIDALAEAPDD